MSSIPFQCLLLVCPLAMAAVLGTIGAPPANGQEPNYDESKVPAYQLPDPLVTDGGQPITEASQWPQRREEILRHFKDQMFGNAPSEPVEVTYRVVSDKPDALDGLATRREVEMVVGRGGRRLTALLLLYLPQKATGPVPAFVGLNFNGNHTTTDEPEIMLTSSWVNNNEQQGITDHRASERSRGANASRWPIRRILERGYALATMYYGDIDPDFDDNFQNGIHGLFATDGQTQPAPDAWGSIGAWAWGLMRIADYLIEAVPQVNPQQIAVMGHSRLGKTALWAGAADTRFALVVSNNSGCGGAALSRRAFGETVGRINRSFPHWFCDNFNQYNENEAALPIDQHELIALIAPRPVLVCSAEEDRWADPRGEFLSALHAAPVYRLLGTDGIASEEMPALNVLLNSTVGYRIRPGQHDVLASDWEAYLDFADRHFRHGSP